MQPLLGALCGVLIVGGVFVFLAGLRAAPDPAPGTPGRTRKGPSRLRRVLGLTPQTTPVGRAYRFASVVAGFVAWLFTGWVVLVLIVPAALLFLPGLIRPRTNEAVIKRVEALEEWLRNLQGLITVGMGIEAALQASAASSPLPIRKEVSALAANLRSGWSSEDALRTFGDDLDSTTADLIVLALILAVRQRGSGLALVLDGLAHSVAQDVRMQRLVEADRAKPRQQARLITLITLAAFLGAFALPMYAKAYSTPLGQMVLLLLVGMYAGALVWMRSMTISKPMPRLLHTGTRRLQEVEQ